MPVNQFTGAVSLNEFNAGSTIFEPVANKIGFSLDQFNFLACQLSALLLSYPFRKFLHPSNVSPSIRHVVEMVVGLFLCHFAYGHQVLHLLLLSTLSYGCLRLLKPVISQRVVLFASLSYLSVVHIYRMYYDYGGYTMDVTGPLMIMVQKVTALAYSYHDGTMPEDKLSEDQKEQMCKEIPSVLEFYSYMFYFHGIMVGPLCFYADYKRFIEGKNYIRLADGSWSNEVVPAHETPSPLFPILEKLAYTVICAYVMLVVCPEQDTLMFLDPVWVASNGFFCRIFVMVKNIGWVRSKYYFAWVFADLINNSAGLGYSGIDPESGRERWNLTKNVDIRRLEMATSLKVNVESWNKLTALWLRRIIYDRLPSSYNLYAVYFVSALWHGFYPGYYITFFSVAFFTMAARKVRRTIRPLFQSSSSMAFIYDIITWTFTRLACPYLAAPFVFLSLKNSWAFYSGNLFFLHILAATAILVLPEGKSARSERNPDATVTAEEQNYSVTESNALDNTSGTKLQEKPKKDL